MLVVVLVQTKKCSGNGGGGTVAAAVSERLFGRASQLTAKERDPTSMRYMYRFMDTSATNNISINATYSLWFKDMFYTFSPIISSHQCHSL